MKTWLLAVSAATLLGASSCDKLSGEGPLVTESRDTGPFTSLQSDIAGTVTVYRAGPAGVEVSAQRNIAGVLKTEVTGGVLHLYVEPHVRLGSYKPMRVTVRCPDLRSAALNGSGALRIRGAREVPAMGLSVSGSGLLQADSLQVDSTFTAALSGSGTLVMDYLKAPVGSFHLGGSGKIQAGAGRVGRLEIALSGSGNTDLGAIASGLAAVHLSGSGDATVGPADTLIAHISGSGNIRYSGTPLIFPERSGSGKLIGR